jgi:hypothetical protein
MRRCLTAFSLITPIVYSLFLFSCNNAPDSSSIDSSLTEISSLNEKELAGYLESLDRRDPIAPYYLDPSTKDSTLQFFSSLTRSENVARVILDNAQKYGVRPSLAFALALEESDFRVDAFNKNPDSVDRGLFQLNSKSYPDMAIPDFYDPAINARYGLAHLKSCLKEAGNEVAALAMYNAGNGRVARGATPKKTLNYVSRILAYEDNISSLFAAKVMAARSPGPILVPGVARLFAESVSMGLISSSAAKKN